MSVDSTHESAWFEAEGEVWIDRLRSAGPVPKIRGGDLAHGQLPHDVISGHILLRQLGHGGQGVVFAALQIATRREVAIKLLREGPIASDAARRRFKREVELAASLDHPGVVRVLSAGETDDGRSYILMELIEGEPLKRWLTTNPPLHKRLRCVADLCTALEHAHLRGVIHLDLKPSNIMRTTDGTMKILDFGLARSVDEQDVTVTLSEAIAAGTPAYMAPEQVEQPRATWDRRTDIYAMGLLLFETITGKRPFEFTGNAFQIMEAIARSQPARLSSCLDASLPIAPRVSRDLDAIVATALAKNPDDRYQTAQALAEDIRAANTGQPVWARRHERGYRWRKFKSEYGSVAAVVSAVMLALLIATIFFVDLSRRERIARKDAVAAETVAQERLQDVRQLANTFLNDLDPMIQHLPGSAPARERIVREGLTYLAQMRIGINGKPEIAAEIASAYTKMGNVLWDKNASHLNDADRALESHVAACDVIAEIAPEAQKSSDLAFVSHKAWLARSVVESHLRRRDDARISLDRAEISIEHLPDVQRLSPQGKLATAQILAQRAALAYASGKIEEAEMLERAVHTQYAQLLEVTPDDPLLRRDYAAGFARIAQLHVTRGKMREALSEYERFRDEMMMVARDMSAPAIFVQKDLATAHEWIGRLHADLGEPEAALVPLTRAIEIRTALAEQDPDVNLQLDIASIVNRLGEAQLAIPQFEDANETFNRFLALATALRHEHPKLSRTHRLEAVAYYKRHELALARATAARTPHAVQEELIVARTALTKCHRIFVEMETNGLLAQRDYTIPMTLAEELAALDTRIAKSME